MLGKHENLTHSPRGPKNTFPEVSHIKFFAFNIKWTKWSLYHLIGLDCGTVVNLCVAYLIMSYNHLISSNPM